MIFNLSKQEWESKKSYWTAKEIAQQPSTWRKTLTQVEAEQEAILKVISSITSNDDFDIVLTGAGTSEFVGNSIYSYIGQLVDLKCKSYATTDIVASPLDYLSKTKPTLLISYGRSGNSPESVAAVEVANVVCENIAHLFITCNKDGALSKFAQENENCYAINLTDETHDQSFAMTSSFSNMYLATLLSFQLAKYGEMKNIVEVVASQTESFLTEKFAITQKIVEDFDFKRIVYLGSTTNKGVAQESALKMCELAAGDVYTVYDTPLGFRHGPKSVVDPTTLTIVLLSDDAYTRKYELDIIKEMSRERNGNKIVALSSKEDAEVESLVDYFVSFNNDMELANVFLGLEYITFAQLLGMFKSLSMNISPDNPCPTGEVNRVVQGVTIYPFAK